MFTHPVSLSLCRRLQARCTVVTILQQSIPCKDTCNSRFSPILRQSHTSMANPVLVAAGAVKAVQAANALAESEHQDGIYRLANSGVPSINGQMVRRIEHVGWGINSLNWEEARDWMLEDKANRIVETVQKVYSTQVLWERVDKTKPMQLAPKGLGVNWLNFYPEAQLLENPVAPAPAAPAPAVPGKPIVITSIETKMTNDITDNGPMDGHVGTDRRNFYSTHNQKEL